MSTAINSDIEFRIIVRNVANGSNLDEPRAIEYVSEYLWRPGNWDRLKDTPYGIFVREHSKNNPCPDVLLRGTARRDVIADNNFEE